MGKTQVTGNAGEEFTVKYLKKKGYKIVARNFRSRFGEIDVIAEKGQYLAFVEVKTRAEETAVRPLEYVTAAKRRKIWITAGIYMQRSASGLQPRFDVAEVFVSPSGKMRLNYFESAFGAESI